MRTTTIYWVLTIGLAWELGFGGVSDLLRLDYVRTTVEHLGYPSYLLTILGVWKLLATVAPLIPGFVLLKEWAYAGSFFMFTGATASHIASGDAFIKWVGQLVYVNDGEERTFQAFEDVAVPLISKYRGELLLRMRPNPESIITAGIEVPYEIHVVRFKSEDDFRMFSDDEDRQRVLHLKNASVRSSLLVRGTAE